MDSTKINGREVRVRKQGQTKSYLETMTEQYTLDVGEQMADSLQSQIMPGSGQKR